MDKIIDNISRNQDDKENKSINFVNTIDDIIGQNDRMNLMQQDK